MSLVSTVVVTNGQIAARTALHDGELIRRSPEGTSSHPCSPYDCHCRAIWYLETQGADCPLQGNAHRLWSGKAVFKWDLVQLGDFGVYEEGYQSSADYYPVQALPEFETGESEGDRSLQYIETIQTSSPKPPSDIVPPDSDFEISNSLMASVMDNRTFSRCFACDNALDANGLCQLCPPEVLFDENPTYPVNPFGGQALSQNQTSENICSSPLIEDLQDWTDPSNFGVQNMGGVSAPSSEPGLHNSSVTESYLPWLMNNPDTSGFGMLGDESATATLTYGLPPVASPTDVFEHASLDDQLFASGSIHGKNAKSSDAHAREVKDSMPVRRLKRWIKEKSRKVRNSKNTDPSEVHNCVGDRQSSSQASLAKVERDVRKCINCCSILSDFERIVTNSEVWLRLVAI